MAGSFKPVSDKLNRAKTHAEAFQRLVDEFEQRKPHAIAMHTDSEPPHWVRFEWKLKEEPSVDFTLVFGDMLSNLRTTLDYLVWQLVLAAGNDPVDRNAFPCTKREADWPSVRGDRLKGVCERWADEVRDLQPYHRAPDMKRHWLFVLDHINNCNKHRTLPPTVLTVPEWTFDISGDVGGREIEAWQDLGHPIEDGYEFARYRITPPLEHEVHYQRRPPIRIAFSDGLDHSDGWGYTNADLIKWVGDAVAIFEPAFPG